MELLGWRACISPNLLDSVQLFTQMAIQIYTPTGSDKVLSTTNLQSHQQWQSSQYYTISPEFYGCSFSSKSLWRCWSFFSQYFLSLFFIYLVSSRSSLRTLPLVAFPDSFNLGYVPPLAPTAPYIVPSIIGIRLYCYACSLPYLAPNQTGDSLKAGVYLAPVQCLAHTGAQFMIAE